LLMLGTVWKGGEGRGVVSLAVDMVPRLLCLLCSGSEVES
jgi:hypothetical protein